MQLWHVWLGIMAHEPRARLEQRCDVRLRSLHVQRSRVFRFPDEIRAEVVALGQDSSGISIDSRARYGFYDFGVNRRRIRRLIAQLEARLEGTRDRRDAV